MLMNVGVGNWEIDFEWGGKMCNFVEYGKD